MDNQIDPDDYYDDVCSDCGLPYCECDDDDYLEEEYYQEQFEDQHPYDYMEWEPDFSFLKNQP